MVVDDVRFPNEVEAIRVLGGVVIEVTPAAAANPATLQHVSEQGGLDWDFSIIKPMGPSFFRSLDLLECEPKRPAAGILSVRWGSEGLMLHSKRNGVVNSIRFATIDRNYQGWRFHWLNIL